MLFTFCPVWSYLLKEPYLVINGAGPAPVPQRLGTTKSSNDLSQYILTNYFSLVKKYIEISNKLTLTRTYRQVGV